jgi:hypothetical protein
MTLRAGAGLAHVPGDRMHQMRLAEPNPAVKKERVERHRWRRSGAGLGHSPGGRVRQLVWLANHKVLEAETLVERCRKLALVVGDIGCSAGFRNSHRRYRRWRGPAYRRRYRAGRPLDVFVARIDDERNAIDRLVL